MNNSGEIIEYILTSKIKETVEYPHIITEVNDKTFYYSDQLIKSENDIIKYLCVVAEPDKDNHEDY